MLIKADLKSDDTLVSRFDSTYDAAGRCTVRSESDWQGPVARTTFAYDPTGQITGEWRDGTGAGLTAFRTTFLYDPLGNRLVEDKSTVQSTATRTTSTYDPANRLLFSDADAGRTTYAYDACGNQIATETPAGALTTTTWDHDDFPTVVEQPDGGLVTMTYGTNTRNAHRQRVCRETGCGETWFLWDNRNVLSEHDGSGTTEVAYVHEPVPEPEPFGKLVAQHRDDQSGWYHFDPQGTTAALTDEAGVIVQDYAHDAWGNVLLQTTDRRGCPDSATCG